MKTLNFVLGFFLLIGYSTGTVEKKDKEAASAPNNLADIQDCLKAAKDLQKSPENVEKMAYFTKHCKKFISQLNLSKTQQEVLEKMGYHVRNETAEDSETEIEIDESLDAEQKDTENSPEKETESQIPPSAKEGKEKDDEKSGDQGREKDIEKPKDKEKDVEKSVDEDHEKKLRDEKIILKIKSLGEKIKSKVFREKVERQLKDSLELKHNTKNQKEEDSSTDKDEKQEAMQKTQQDQKPIQFTPDDSFKDMTEKEFEVMLDTVLRETDIPLQPQADIPNPDIFQGGWDPEFGVNPQFQDQPFGQEIPQFVPPNFGANVPGQDGQVPPQWKTGIPNSGFQQRIPNPEFQQGFPNPEFQQRFPNPEFQQRFPNPEFQQRFPNPEFHQGFRNPEFQQRFPNPGFQQGVPNPGFQQGVPNPGFQQGVPNPGFQQGIPQFGQPDRDAIIRDPQLMQDVLNGKPPPLVGQQIPQPQEGSENVLNTANAAESIQNAESAANAQPAADASEDSKRKPASDDTEKIKRQSDEL